MNIDICAVSPHPENEDEDEDDDENKREPKEGSSVASSRPDMTTVCLATPREPEQHSKGSHSRQDDLRSSLHHRGSCQSRETTRCAGADVKSVWLCLAGSSRRRLGSASSLFPFFVSVYFFSSSSSSSSSSLSRFAPFFSLLLLVSQGSLFLLSSSSDHVCVELSFETIDPQNSPQSDRVPVCPVGVSVAVLVVSAPV